MQSKSYHLVRFLILLLPRPLDSIASISETLLPGSVYDLPATADSNTGAIPKSPRSTNHMPFFPMHYSSASDRISPTGSPSQVNNQPPSGAHVPYSASAALLSFEDRPTVTALASTQTPSGVSPTLAPLNRRLHLRPSQLHVAQAVLCWSSPRHRNNNSCKGYRITPLPMKFWSASEGKPTKLFQISHMLRGRSPDQVIASFKVRYPHDFNAIAHSSF